MLNTKNCATKSNYLTLIFSLTVSNISSKGSIGYGMKVKPPTVIKLNRITKYPVLYTPGMDKQRPVSQTKCRKPFIA